ncbi:MAG: hypothetical protein ACSLEL_02905 [Candidatus Malihini olakiniferum]
MIYFKIDYGFPDLDIAAASAARAQTQVIGITNVAEYLSDWMPS